MARAKVKSQTSSSNEYRTPMTLDAEEAEMIALATKVAKQQLIDGTASSQVITHYLKLGTTIAKLEKEVLIAEAKLKQAKTHQIDNQDEILAAYKEAVKAMTSYSPTPDDESEESDGY